GLLDHRRRVVDGLSADHGLGPHGSPLRGRPLATDRVGPPTSCAPGPVKPTPLAGSVGTDDTLIPSNLTLHRIPRIEKGQSGSRVRRRGISTPAGGRGRFEASRVRYRCPGADRRRSVRRFLPAESPAQADLTLHPRTERAACMAVILSVAIAISVL